VVWLNKPISTSGGDLKKIHFQRWSAQIVLGMRLQIKVFTQQKESNSHAKILYEEHVKNRFYLKLNFKNEEHLLRYQWPLLALGKNLFASPITRS
jgi:hypothetical protein